MCSTVHCYIFCYKIIALSDLFTRRETDWHQFGACNMLWIVACCWMLAVTLTDAHEKVRLCMRLLPAATLMLSLCFSVSVHLRPWFIIYDEVLDFLIIHSASSTQFVFIYLFNGLMLVAFSALTLLVGRQEGYPACKNMGGWWRWALVSPDGVVPSRIVGVSASGNLPLYHKVQKFSAGTGSPGWSWKKRP